MKIDQLIKYMLIGFILVMAFDFVYARYFAKPVPPAVVARGPVLPALPAPAPAARNGKNAPAKGAAGAPGPQNVILGGAAKGQPYHLAISLNDVSAGINWVKINAKYYRQKVGDAAPYLLMTAPPDAPLPFATGSVKIAGYGVFNAPATDPWQLHRHGPLFATFTFRLGDAKLKPLVELYKTFRINPKTYDVRVNYRIKNLTAAPLTVRVNQYGPVNLPRHGPMDGNRDFMGALYDANSHYLGASGVPLVAEDTAQGSGFQPKVMGDFQGVKRLVWASASNRFFTIIVRPTGWPGAVLQPVDSGGSIPKISYLKSVTVRRVDPEPSLANPRAPVALQITGQNLLVPAHGAVSMPLSVFMGPKKRSLLEGNLAAPATTPAYAYGIYRYMKVIQLDQGPCAFCTISWLSLFILRFLDFIHGYIANWGIAIMVLVILVRLLLHPLTRYGQVNMAMMQRKMAKIQPELERIKTRYAKDKTQQQQEIMKVYKDHKVNPASSVMGCLPMLLQMPIWIALYAGLSVDIDLRHAMFIPGWITDLANPDTVAKFHMPFQVPFIGYTVHGQAFLPLNILPLLLTVVFFMQMKWQMRLGPKPTDPQQAQTQMISQFMILLFPIFLYNRPSGLNLYIFASTAGGLFDTYLVRRHLKAKGLLPGMDPPEPEITPVRRVARDN